MRFLLLTSAASALLASTAFSADLPVYEEAPVAPLIAAAPLWTGAYLGGQLGYSFLHDGDDFESDEGALEGGLFVGADAQFGGFVLGGLADWNWVDHLDRRQTVEGDSFDIQASAGAISAIFQQADAVAIAAAAQARADAGGGAAGEAAANAAAAASAENWFNNLLNLSERTTIVAAGEGVDPADFEFPSAAFNLDDILDDLDAGTVTELANYSENLHGYGTVRGRAGFGTGRVLFYGTGGLAFGSVNRSWTAGTSYDADAADLMFGDTGLFEVPEGYDPDTATAQERAALQEEFLNITDFDPADGDVLPSGCSATGTDSSSGVTCNADSDSDEETRFGWALGAGVELLATEHFSVGAEYLYVNIDGSDGDEEGLGEAVVSTFDIAEDDDFNFSTLKMKAAYRF
jgi:opacity protein-like surface antigen